MVEISGPGRGKARWEDQEDQLDGIGGERDPALAHIDALQHLSERGGAVWQANVRRLSSMGIHFTVL